MGEDGDSRRNTSLGSQSQDGGSGSRLGAGSLTPRGSDQLLRQQAFRRRSCTPVRGHDRSRSASSDSSEAGRSVAADAGPVDRPVVADRPVEAADRTGRSAGRSSRTGRRRERSVSSSPSDSELERESRRERHRHGRSRRRGDRAPTPPQTSSLASDQILKAIAELKSVTDAVASRVGGGWSGGRVLRTLLIPHDWRRRIFLCVRRGTIACHRRRRVAVIGAHNTENTTVSPKCCRATVSRRWRRHGQLPSSWWAVTRLFLPGTRRPGGTRIRCKTYSPSTPTWFHRMYQWTMCLG